MDRFEKLSPDNLRETLQDRLCEAERRTQRAQMLVDWQQRLVDQMVGHGRRDVGLAEEVLASLRESQLWNQAQAEQIKRELDFLDRHSGRPS